jgi:acetyl esterase/lipase/Tol biopolymer transport system component
MPREPPPFERFSQCWVTGEIGFFPNGQLIFVNNISGQFNVWTMELGPHGEPGHQRQITGWRERTARSVVPFPDNHTIILRADEGGDEQHQLYRLDIRGGDPVPITADRKVRHELGYGALDRTGRRLLYSDNERNKSDMDVVVHDLPTGAKSRPLPTGFLWAGAYWDPTGTQFAAHQLLSNTQVRAFIHDVRRRSTLEVLPHETEEVVEITAFLPDGKHVLVRNDLSSEFMRLEEVDYRTGSRRVIAAPKAQVEFADYSPKSGLLVYGVNHDGYTDLFSGPVRGPMRRITNLPKGWAISGFGEGQMAQITPDGRTLVAGWATGTQPASLLWIPLKGGKASFLTENMIGGVPDAPLPPPKLVKFPTFDGRMIPAFYYLPKHRPKGRIPVVLSIHGGPEAQERPSWGYYGLYQYLTANGIGVLAPNIRGSTGYGRAYQRLIYHDWGGAELKDLRAAAEWLRTRPEVDPNRLGVFGGSFGGFATLSCVTRLPEYWKVGVDVVGPSNLLTFVKSVPPFWIRFMDKWVGNPERDADLLRERSPITYVENVRADLLIIQGANDPRVNKAESVQMVERLKELGRYVEYFELGDEGHGATKVDNMLKMMHRSGKFLVDRLQGPAPPAS